MKTKLPPREKLPRKCKLMRWYGPGVYVEMERALKCQGCGSILSRRDASCSHVKSKFFKYLPKEKTVEVSSPENLECAICLNSLNLKRMLLLLCNHRFHKKCILQWFEQDQRCPLCRK